QNCKSTLKTVHTLKRKFSDGAYFSIIDIVKNYQVIRNFEIKGSYVKNQTADIFCQELCQIWITKNRKFEIYGKAHFLNWYQDSWTGAFEIRRKERSSLTKYDINPYR